VHLGLCEDCPAGKYTAKENADTCDACPPGKHKETKKAFFCDMCEPGRFGSGDVSQSASTYCQPCARGQFQKAGGNTSCVSCSAGQFQDQQGQTMCLAVQRCRNGTYQTAAPMASTDRSCATCATGKFSDSNNAVACKACDDGQFQDHTGQSTCRMHTVCAAGSRMELAPSTTTDRACEACLAGQVSTSENAKRCDNCTKGRYQPSPEQIACTGCARGRVGTTIGSLSSTTCAECPAGQVNPSTGKVACQACAIGKVQDHTGQVSCVDCPGGRYQNLPRETQCNECPNGKFTNGTSTGGVLCLACKAGLFGNANRGANASSDTHTAFTANKASALHCHGCPPTFFQPDQGRASCKKCKPGRPCPANSTFEGVCKANEFVMKDKQECRACPRIGPDDEADCGNGNLIMRNGFFSSASFSKSMGDITVVSDKTEFTKCPCTECCAVNSYTGTTMCRLGTSGSLCAVCQKEPVRYHRKLDDTCVPCPQESISDFLKEQTLQFVTIGLIVLLCTGLLAMDARAEWRCCRKAQKQVQGTRRLFISKLRIMVNFGQIITLFETVYNVHFPAIFKDFLLKLAFFRIDFFRWIPLDCYTDFDFHAGLVVSTLCFLALALLAAGAKKLTHKQPRNASTCTAKLSKLADTFVVGSLIVAYSVYPSLSAKVFATFNCRAVAGDTTEPLTADYSIDSKDAAHTTYESYAIVMVILISAGTPALYLYLLWRNHAAIHRGEQNVQHLLFLCQDYHPECWYWEVCVCCSALLFTDRRCH
jgi:hypothetical protein